MAMPNPRPQAFSPLEPAQPIPRGAPKDRILDSGFMRPDVLQSSVSLLTRPRLSYDARSITCAIMLRDSAVTAVGLKLLQELDQHTKLNGQR